MKFIDQIDIKGKKILMRVDFNVPLDGKNITDDNRIRAGLKTINYVLEQGAALIVCSHLGKPKGKVAPALSLDPVARRLSQLTGREVKLAPGCVGSEVEALAAAVEPGQILMLENLRFYPEETGKTPEERGDFGRNLAKLADIYLNDAFAVAHRENASVVDIPKYSKVCCAGFLMRSELEYLGGILDDPRHPYVAVSGGAKVSSKLGIIDSLMGKVDHFIIGGAMANTFLLAQGHGIGKSLAERDLVDKAKKIIASAKASGTNLHLPVDVVLGKDVSDSSPSGVVSVDAVPEDAMILDIGPETVKDFIAALDGVGTVVWNGPMGLFENPAFAKGSLDLCRAIAGLDAVTIVGGGDTDAVVHGSGMADKFTYISTGGGAFLEFMEGKELPAYKALRECGK